MKINPAAPGQLPSSADDAPIPAASTSARSATLSSRSSGSMTSPRRTVRQIGTSSSSTSGPPADWGARAAHSRTVPVTREDGSISQATLWLPAGMIDHPLRNSAQLSVPRMTDEIKTQLDKPPAHAVVEPDGSGDVQWDLEGRGKLEVVFKSGGQITSLLLRAGSQTIQLSDQQWLRGALQNAGKTVPAGASVWQSPAGDPVACDPALPLQNAKMPEAFRTATGNASADHLFQQALDAMCEGSARRHRSMGAGRAQFEFDVFGQVLIAEYQHADHAVHSLQLSWQPPELESEKQPLAHWSGLDDEVLALTRTAGKRKRNDEVGYSSDEDGEQQRRLEAVMGHRTEIMDFAGLDEMDTGLDDLLVSSRARTPSRAETSTAVETDNAPAIEAAASRASSPTRQASPMSLGSRTGLEQGSPPEQGRSSMSVPALPPLPMRIPSVLISHGARAKAAVDCALNALADCFTTKSRRSASSSFSASGGQASGASKKSNALKLPANLRPFLESVLQGDGTTPAGSHASVRVFEKVFTQRHARLPAAVRQLDCVRQAEGGGTKVKLLAVVRPNRTDRITDVRAYSAENLAALDAAARSGQPPADMQPLPTPAQINDTLQGLFVGRADARLLRLLALLQTPRYGMPYEAIMTLTVASNGEDRHIAGVTFVGQDGSLPDDAPDNDWKRIVEPWLAGHSDDDDRVWTANRAKLPTSFKALAEALPSLGHMSGKGVTAVNALEGAAAAGLEAAGVPPNLLQNQDQPRATVLKLGHVAADGSCPPANLSDAARSALSTWVALRRKALGDQPEEWVRQQPIFLYTSSSHAKGGIGTYWNSVERMARGSTTAPDVQTTAVAGSSRSAGP